MTNPICRTNATDHRDYYPHEFLIPVMGTGFTIDTPLRVAKYGISSVISIVDDILIEQMRKFHSEREGIQYEPIGNREEDARARRIASYLDLVENIVRRQTEELRRLPFKEGNDIDRYFRLLPTTSSLRLDYEHLAEASQPDERARLEKKLRDSILPGSIDVNIMTKLDREVYRRGEKLPPEYRDGMSALRGFAMSQSSSSIVFSAGINQRLYEYAAEFEDFLPDVHGKTKKGIILKVSDFRSAEIQGRYLAKKGLWVSEFRIESGLNCGGHAFATVGRLLGPILEEFKTNRSELVARLFATYRKSLSERGRSVPDIPPPVRITVQGGIGTHEEHQYLLDRYGVDATGWGTPFLLVPEVANVDDIHLARLAEAKDGDVYLSDCSPLGIPFWSLRTSSSEEHRRHLVETSKPGSPCPKEFLVSNTEYTDRPTCTGSRTYQQSKLNALPKEGLTLEQENWTKASVLNKTCLCRDLSGSVLLKNHLAEKVTPAVCCGPNIVNFSKIATLNEMVDHIYGRLSLITNPNRPHMFLREISLYVDHFKKEVEKLNLGLSSLTPKYFEEFKTNLLSGLEYYRGLAGNIVDSNKTLFPEQLESMRRAIDESLSVPA
jgi:hypothetical protein